MTGGTVVILGPVGENFAAGMTGGKAFVFDDFELLEQKTNLETVKIISLTEHVNEAYEKELRQLLSEHIENTRSRWGQKVINNFDNYIDGFKVVIPKINNKSKITEPLQLLTTSAKVAGISNE
jgi:glutamate synthase domain-containing protein 3